MTRVITSPLMQGPTQAQIAAALQVSRSTVAAVLSNSPSARISREVAARVVQKASEMGYRPNRYSKIMRKGRSGIIGVIKFGGLQQMPTQKLMYAVRAIAEAGYEPVVHDCFWFADRGGSACEKMIDLRVEGVLLIHPNLFFTGKHLDILLKVGIPVVSMGGDHLQGIPRILSDKEKGFYELTRHLLGLGHRRLTLLLGKDSSDRKRTLSWHYNKAKAGFKKAIHEQPGANGSIHVVHYTLRAPQESADPTLYETGAQAMREILSQGTLPEAVLCSNDNWALGALTVCAEADIRVPDELAITGFENEPAGSVGLLPLTTVAHPVREIAQRAVDRLMGAVRERNDLEPTLDMIPGQLMVRRSCGAWLKSPGRAARPEAVKSSPR